MPVDYEVHWYNNARSRSEVLQAQRRSINSPLSYTQHRCFRNASQVASKQPVSKLISGFYERISTSCFRQHLVNRAIRRFFYIETRIIHGRLIYPPAERRAKRR